jgi:hypothetical protein
MTFFEAACDNIIKSEDKEDSRSNDTCQEEDISSMESKKGDEDHGLRESESELTNSIPLTNQT